MKATPRMKMNKSKASIVRLGPLILGVALLIMWEQALFRLSLPVGFEFMVGGYEGTRLDGGWLAFVASIAIFSTVLFVISRKSKGLVFHFWVSAFGALIACIGSMLILFVSNNLFCLVLGGVLAGVGAVPVFAFAIQSLGVFSFGEIALTFSMAGLFQAVVTVPLVCVVQPATYALVCAFPALAIFALSKTGGIDAHKGGGSSAAAEDDIEKKVRNRKTVVCLASCFLAFFFVVFYTNVTGFRFNSYSPLAYYELALTLNALSGIVVAFVFAAISRWGKQADLMPFIVVFSVTALLIVSFFSNDSRGMLLADVFAASGRYLALSNAVFAFRRLGGTGAKGEAFLIQALASLAVLVSVVVGQVVYVAMGEGLSNIMIVTTIALYLLLVFFGFYVSRANSPVTFTIRGELVGNDELAECRARMLAYRYPALTAKETEVVKLMLLGRNAAGIAEGLVISLNTAKTHIRHVYQKLDIHSRQELLTLVANTVSEEEAKR